MLRIKMPDLVTKSKFLIPGGWVLVVGQWTIDAERESQWIAALLPKHQHNPLKARTDARQRAEAMGASFEKEAIIDFVKRAADLYGKRHPNLVEDGKLKGFDPARVQTLFLPYKGSYGRDGNIQLRALLSKMAIDAQKGACGRDGGIAA
jgi:hypothetical protein